MDFPALSYWFSCGFIRWNEWKNMCDGCLADWADAEEEATCSAGTVVSR